MLVYWVILYWYYIKVKYIYNILPIPCQKSKMVSFGTSRMKSIVIISGQSRFPGKLICYIAFGSASTASFLVKSIAIILHFSLEIMIL